MAVPRYTYKIVINETGISKTLEIDLYNPEEVLPTIKSDDECFIVKELSKPIKIQGTYYQYLFDYLNNNRTEKLTFYIYDEWKLLSGKYHITGLTNVIYKGYFTFYNILTFNDADCIIEIEIIADTYLYDFKNKYKTKYNIFKTTAENSDVVINPAKRCLFQRTVTYVDTVDGSIDEEFPTDLELYDFDKTVSHGGQIHLDETNIVNIVGAGDGTTWFADWNVFKCEYYEVSPYIWRFVGTLIREVFYYKEIIELDNIPSYSSTTPNKHYRYRGIRTINGTTVHCYSITTGKQDLRSFTYKHPYTPHETHFMVGSVHHYTYTTGVSYFDPKDYSFDNCRTLKNVINMFLENMGFANYESMFLNDAINPITNEASITNHLLLGYGDDLSYRKYLGEYQLCQKYEMSMYDILEMLKLFQIMYYFDDSGVIHFEHVNYFENGLSYDSRQIEEITVDDHDVIFGDTYNIDSSKIFTKETITQYLYGNKEPNGTNFNGFNDFAGLPIIYPEILSENESVLQLNFATDILRVHFGALTNNIVRNIVLIAAREWNTSSTDYNVTWDVSKLGDYSGIHNGHLAISMIHDRYYKVGKRSSTVFNMNGVNNNLPSTIITKIKTIQDVKVKYCADINYYKYLKINDREEAKILEMEYDIYTGYYTLKLGYDV